MLNTNERYIEFMPEALIRVTVWDTGESEVSVLCQETSVTPGRRIKIVDWKKKKNSGGFLKEKNHDSGHEAC